MISPAAVAPWTTAPILCKCPVFLGTTLFWIWVTRTAIIWRLYGVVVALMKFYAPIALLLLTATSLWRVPLLWANEPGTAALCCFASNARERFGPLDDARLLCSLCTRERRLGSRRAIAATSSRGAAMRLGRRGLDLARVAPGCIRNGTVDQGSSWPDRIWSGGSDAISFRWAVFQGTETFPPVPPPPS